MTLAPPPATAEAAGAGLPPLLPPPALKLSPEQFAQVCDANPEVDRSPADLGGSAGGLGGFRQLHWLPSARGSVLSPDASAVRLERWQTLMPEQRRSFPPLWPDLVIELASPSVAAGFSEGVEGPRGATALRRKMTTYLANGARLAWLLFPEQQAVEIWRAPADPASSATSERLAPATPLEDGELLPGLRLDLAELWAV